MTSKEILSRLTIDQKQYIVSEYTRVVDEPRSRSIFLSPNHWAMAVNGILNRAMGVNQKLPSGVLNAIIAKLT